MLGQRRRNFGGAVGTRGNSQPLRAVVNRRVGNNVETPMKDLVECMPKRARPWHDVVPGNSLLRVGVQNGGEEEGYPTLAIITAQGRQALTRHNTLRHRRGSPGSESSARKPMPYIVSNGVASACSLPPTLTISWFMAGFRVNLANVPARASLPGTRSQNAWSNPRAGRCFRATDDPRSKHCAPARGSRGQVKPFWSSGVSPSRNTARYLHRTSTETTANYQKGTSRREQRIVGTIKHRGSQR